MSMADNQTARAVANLRAAVRTARDAAEKADREINLAGDVGTAAQAILHALTWGHANAMTNVQTALAAIEDSHIIRAMEAKTPPPTAAWFVVTRSGEALNPQLGEPTAYAREHATKEGHRIVLLAAKGTAS